MTASPIPLTPETEVLLAAVREKLAGQFTTQLLMRVPAVADMLEMQADQSKDKDGGDRLRAASSILKTLKGPLQNGLMSSLRRQFDRKLKPEQIRSLGTLTLDTLELVDAAQMEEEIAVGKVAIRLKEQINFEFFSLSRRLCHLTNIENIPDRDNPVFPLVFANALMDALRHCGCQAAQRLVLFDAFGPALIEAMPATYQDANDFLIQQGVLIEIKESYGRAILGKSAAIATGATIASATTTVSASAGSPLIVPVSGAKGGNAELIGLLHQVLHLDQKAKNESGDELQRVLGSIGSADTAADLAGTEDGNALSVSLRAKMKQALAVQAGYFSQRQDSAEASDAVLSAAADARQNPQQVGVAQRIENLDLAKLMTSSIIVAAFNRLLASPPIREHVGALLLQLQLPTIHAAIAAPDLLTDEGHAVRTAVDRLIEFAIAQPALLHPGTTSYESLASIIGRLPAEYDALAFATVAEKIDALFSYHEDTAAEQDPKAKMLVEIELVESAINSANHAIESRLNQRAEDPEFICTFVRVVWKEVLFGDMLNGGAAGDLWRRDISTLESLLRSVRPQNTAEERAALLRNLPLLQGHLDEGAKSVGADAEYVASFLAQLRAIHTRSLSGTLRRNDADVRTGSYVTLAQGNSSQLEATGHFSAMPHLVRGRWIEFNDEANGKRRRARLNWMSPIGAVCLFKDYLENDTFTLELKDLNDQLNRKTARLVESLGVSRHAIEFAIRNIGLVGEA